MSKQYSTFTVDGHLFGVPVEEVQEVIRYQEMTQVPLASEDVGGLINLRGQIVTAIDLRRRLNMEDRAEGVLPMNVVLNATDGHVSLLVDQIGDVLDVEDDAFEAPPETLSGPARALITGAFKLEGRLLLVLDTKKTVNLADAA